MISFPTLDNLIISVITNYDKNNFGIKDKIFFFKQLGYLLSGGVGILKSVETIKNSTDNYAIKELSKNIMGFLNEGKPLSYGLLRESTYFDDGDITIVKSGEKAGNLAQVLRSLANEYEFINKMKNKYIGALIYPAILIVVAAGAIIALFAYVLPGIFEITSQMPGVTLPTITIVLKKTSDFIVNNRKVILGGTFMIMLGLSIVFSTKTGQIFFYRSLLNLPVLGRITQSYYLIKFSRYTKIMLNAGMNYIDVFSLLKNILGVPIYTPLLDNIIQTISKGEPINKALNSDTEIIPGSVSAIIKVGEETANLQESFQTIISIYEEELNENINNLSKLIEPIMLVGIGGVIIFVALGVFGVITSIMEGVGSN